MGVRNYFETAFVSMSTEPSPDHGDIRSPNMDDSRLKPPLAWVLILLEP